MRERKFDTPDWLLTCAEQFQAIEQFAAVRGLIRVFAGSSSPAYHQAVWETADQLVGENGSNHPTIPVAEADATAGAITAIIPRQKKRVAVVGAGGMSMDNLLDKNKALPALTYVFRGKIHVGLLRSRGLGAEYLDDDVGTINTAAFRLGRTAMGVGIGAWVAKEKTIVVPKDLKILEPNLSFDELENSFPNTPLV